MIGALKRILKRFLTIKHIVNLEVNYVLPTSRFRGKNVMIVGGTSGIGLAIAKSFIAEGANVLVCSRSEKKIVNAIKQLNSSAVKSLVVDIADASVFSAKIQEAAELLGGHIDVFINCAGVSAYDGKSDCEDVYDYIMDINMRGLYWANKFEGDYFIHDRQGKTTIVNGKIINITSKGGDRVVFDPYMLSKNGANAITRANARRMAPYQVNVNGVAPGRVPTHITAELEQYVGSSNLYTERHSTKRFTLPEEVAQCCLYLASGEANNIVGQIVAIDGGIYD